MTEFEQELGIVPEADPTTAADIAVDAGDRPSWLPENFESPEALAQSYREAQNKIREQGTELNQFKALFDAQQQVAVNDPSDEWVQYVDRLSALQHTDPETALQGTAALASMATRQRVAEMMAGRTGPQFGNDPDPTAIEAAQIEGFRIAAAQIPNLAESVPAIQQYLEAQPQQAQALNSADPRQQAAMWTNSFQAVYGGQGGAPVDQETMRGLQRTMKLQAQSAVGAGGRNERVPSDVAEWQKISQAHPTRYWE